MLLLLFIAPKSKPGRAFPMLPINNKWATFIYVLCKRLRPLRGCAFRSLTEINARPIFISVASATAAPNHRHFNYVSLLIHAATQLSLNWSLRGLN